MTPYGTAAPASTNVKSERDVTVILDIDEPFDRDWSFLITPGVWKRICMNLVSNALKYTPSGHVRIALKKQWLPETSESPRIAQVTLLVEDTGIGMSQAFQAQHLFRPFKQENSLSQGTGLGLNLVAKLAKAEGGTVHVKSKRGQGTSICVTLPLRSATVSKDEVAILALSTRKWLGTITDFIGFSTTEDSGLASAVSHSDAQQRLSSSLHDIIRHLGLRPRPVAQRADARRQPPDLRIIQISEPYGQSQSSADNSAAAISSLQSLLDTPSVVICATRASALRLRDACAIAGIAGDAQFLWRPIGPSKLATAIVATMSPAWKDLNIAERNTAEITSAPTQQEYQQTVEGATDRAIASRSAQLVPDLQKVDIALRSRGVSKVKDRDLVLSRDSPPVFDTPSMGDIDQVAAHIEKQETTATSMLLLLVDDNVSRCGNSASHCKLSTLLIIPVAYKPSHPHCLRSQGWLSLHNCD